MNYQVPYLSPVVPPQAFNDGMEGSNPDVEMDSDKRGTKREGEGHCKSKRIRKTHTPKQSSFPAAILPTASSLALAVQSVPQNDILMQGRPDVWNQNNHLDNVSIDFGTLDSDDEEHNSDNHNGDDNSL